MANTAGTPLTRYGSRTPAIPARTPARTTRQTGTGAGRPPAASPASNSPAEVQVPATVRTMIVCLPQHLPTAALADGRDLTGLGITATATPRFWTLPKVRTWHRSALIDIRPGKPGPRWCSGGPIRLLDLQAMRHAYGLAAAIRHQVWGAAVRGTRNAAAWSEYLRRHLQYGDRYPLAAADRDFLAQPRVLAMRAHNAAQPHGPQLDPYEVDAYQAGAAAYQHLHAAGGVCADAVITANSTNLRPASGELTDRIGYLAAAHAHLARLRDDDRLLAITL